MINVTKTYLPDEEEDLFDNRTIQKYLIVQQGREIEHNNLDIIISVSYRVNFIELKTNAA